MSVSKMSEFADDSSRQCFSFHHSSFEYRAHKLSEEQESENLQNVAQIDEVSAVGVVQTSNSPAWLMSILQNVTTSSESVTSGVVEKDHDLTVAEEDCVMTIKIVKPSVYPGLTPSGNMETSGCEVSSHERDEVDRTLPEDMTGSRTTFTPVKGLWPLYSKRRSRVLGGHEATPWKSKRFVTTDMFVALESGKLSKKLYERSEWRKYVRKSFYKKKILLGKEEGLENVKMVNGRSAESIIARCW